MILVLRNGSKDGNAAHKDVLGKSVRYVNISSELGTSPVSNDYLQLTRLYGYPHASGSGQGLISTKARAVLAGTDSEAEDW
jgi:hypothetical protein